MDVLGTSRVGLPYPQLVPASLLPPEDPSSSGGRTVRDWFVDVVLFLTAAGTGFLLFAGVVDASTGPVSDGLQTLDLGFGVLACVALWGRRRWPVGVAVVTVLLSVVSAASAPASVVGLFGVAVHRRTSVALAVVALNLAVSAAFAVLRPEDQPFWLSMLIGVVAAAVVTAWGMFVRARRQLVWTLRERAEKAEAEQRGLAEQARRAERTRIAREMHDVLAHRISMMALHAGGLQVRPDLPVDQVRETAGLLRTTAQQALEELRGVIGVLREGPAHDPPDSPQPTLCDLPRLVDETRRTGAKIAFDLNLPEGVEPPAHLGRDAYRIVQESLTNVAKHARGTSTTVHVNGAPGDGLRITVRNRMPMSAARSTIPGSGSGLLGLAERAALAGGTLEHGPDANGDFVVDARLAW